ncbi:MAG: TetR/AcrR family transcriptional regulator [Desulfobacteraceae bacterium]|nr:TetR/AcrR family transcriptional regulator [Desulfobacteraceae bacterium]MBC2756350.1 TetR/AcrR family transcriptional regulator [Desulfobacteraceae bacterium]
MKALSKALSQRQQAEKQERIERIMNAGRKVFLKKGYLSSTIRDIALEAELSPGLIYFYFKGKDEIYGRICKEAFHILLGYLKEAAKTAGDAFERAEAIAYAYIDFYTSHNNYFDIISFKDMGFKKVGVSEKLQKELDNLSFDTLSIFNDSVTDLIKERNIQTDADSWKLTFALWGFIEGSLFIHKRGYFDIFDLNLKDVIELQLQIIKEGTGRK